MNANPKTKTFRIKSLVRSHRFQVRDKLDQKTINKYAAVYSSGRAMPPIKVAMVDGSAVVVDGWHRLAALEKLGRKHAEAEVAHATQREARWLAGRANLEHGLPLKSKELRAVFRAYIGAKQHRGPDASFKSYRQIAEELGGTRRYTTIRNWMRKDYPSVFGAMGGDEPFGETGGLRDLPAVDFVDAVVRALNDALAASKGVNSAEDRWRLVEFAKEVAKKIEAGGPVEQPDF